MIKNLQHLIARLGIPVNDWDVILVGDGSGSAWHSPCGWACTLMFRERRTGHVHYLTPFTGATSRGSIQWCEAMPYWCCLRYHYHEMNGKQHCQQGGVRVDIVSDSEWVCNTMSGQHKAKTHEDMVMLFQWYKEHGYDIHWHHMPRTEVYLNVLMDEMSAEAREYISAMEYPPVSDLFPAAADSTQQC